MGYFTHFGSHFDPLEAKIWYNQFLEKLKNVKNDLSRAENGVVGTKISILAFIVSEIPHFTFSASEIPYFTFSALLAAILTPQRPKFGITNFLRCSKISKMNSAGWTMGW